MTLLAVITNRASTRNLRGDNWIDPVLAGESGVLHFGVTDVAQIPEVIRQCAAARTETIVVNGGDGTVDLVMGALLNSGAYSTPPALALLPAGKTNMTAAGWSLTGKPEAALTALLQRHRTGGLAQYTTLRSVLSIKREGQAPLYGAFFGAAEVVEGILFTRRRIYPLGLPNALSHTAAIGLLLWRSLFTRGTSSAITVRQDDTAIDEGRFFVVAVTALDELLLGLKPMPSLSSGPLHYLSLRMGARSVLGAVPHALSGKIAPGNGRIVRRANRLTLNFTGAYTLDGELYETHAGETLTIDSDKSLPFVRLPS